MQETRLPGRGGDMQVDGKASLGNGRDSHLLGLKWPRGKEPIGRPTVYQPDGNGALGLWGACVGAGTDTPPARNPPKDGHGYVIWALFPIDCVFLPERRGGFPRVTPLNPSNLLQAHLTFGYLNLFFSP